MQFHPLHQQHERSFESNRFVYPVISRRSGGVSVGVNLNPDKICNFDCIYCQVDRTSPGERDFDDLPQLLAELEHALLLAHSGELFLHGKFAATPHSLRRLNDMAFSGDGEPTTYKNFDDVVSACAALKRRLALSDVKMVLITNASMFHRRHVQQGLEILDANQGEIWAKLDAGTEAYFRLVDRTTIPFDRILRNITIAAQQRPIVVQSLFMKVCGQGPAEAEIGAYCGRIGDVLAAGGSISRVQVYTIARPPAESFVAPLARAEVDFIAEAIRQRTGLPAECYYGTEGDA